MSVNLELLEALKKARKQLGQWACGYRDYDANNAAFKSASAAIAHAEAAMCHARQGESDDAACSCLSFGGDACHMGDGCRAMEKVRRLSEPRNFCPRCGKRLRDGDVHTCTPPMDAPTDCAGAQHASQQEAEALVGLRGCNSRHGTHWGKDGDPCVYRMRSTDPGCTGCADRDEDQSAEAGG